MAWSALGWGNFSWAFFLDLLNIIVINLILSGDNAVVIAMAARSLPPAQRRRGIILGAGLAVILRVALTVFVVELLAINLVKFAGGALIAWIAVKLMAEAGGEESGGQEAATPWQAIRLIVIADLTMSLDNVLAVAGASQGNLLLLVLGLALSIPFVIFASNLLSYLMDRYPFIVDLGALVLGRVAGEMMLGDPLVEKWLQPSLWLRYTVQALCAVGVVAVGKFWSKWCGREQVLGQTAKDKAREDQAAH